MDNCSHELPSDVSSRLKSDKRWKDLSCCDQYVVEQKLEEEWSCDSCSSKRTPIHEVDILGSRKREKVVDRMIGESLDSHCTRKSKKIKLRYQ